MNSATHLVEENQEEKQARKREEQRKRKEKPKREFKKKLIAANATLGLKEEDSSWRRMKEKRRRRDKQFHIDLKKANADLGLNEGDADHVSGRFSDDAKMKRIRRLINTLLSNTTLTRAGRERKCAISMPLLILLARKHTNPITVMLI